MYGGISMNNEKQGTLGELDKECLALFDRLCERRSVLPLAHLMHGWSLVDQSGEARQRLFYVLSELRRWHRDNLKSDELLIIDEILLILADGYGITDSSLPEVSGR